MAVYYHSTSLPAADNLQTLCLRQASSAGSFNEALAGSAEIPTMDPRPGGLFVPPASEIDGLSSMADTPNERSCYVISADRGFQGHGLSLSLLPVYPTNTDEKAGGMAQRKGFWYDADSTIHHPGLLSFLLHSKYLRPTQQLLDQAVSIKQTRREKDPIRGQGFPDSLKSDGNASVLSSSERLALLNNKTQLMAMLEEVDKRYNQYYNQVQALAASFESSAGFGAAKAYISVALHRISRHFRSLRDAIKSQIQMTRNKLGEGGDFEIERLPRLRYVDHQVRQQKAIQQFGVVKPAWRPQRGLPESSVSILRAWLFEHFLHPYPRDSEKLMLAKQTGLSKNQVANWFINARVRLWKPMIEKMYKEEFGDSEADSNSSTLNMPEDLTEDSRASEEKATIPTVSQNTRYVQHVDHIALQSQKFQNGAPHMSLLSGSVDPGDEISLALGLQHQEDDLFASSIRSSTVDDYHHYLVMGNHQINDFAT